MYTYTHTYICTYIIRLQHLALILDSDKYIYLYLKICVYMYIFVCRRRHATRVFPALANSLASVIHGKLALTVTGLSHVPILTRP